MPRTILLVEDSEDDVFFAMRGFKAAGLASPILRVEDGRGAIHYLSGRGQYADRAKFPFPHLILLDIKMPFVTGFDVLQWIRERSHSPQLPVIIFTSSNQESDIERAYALGANAYLVKPNQPDDFCDLAGLIKRFWLDANLPPPLNREPAEPDQTFLYSLLQEKEQAGF
ncbi:MAG: response regulator [Verrucomicrobiales bacterium]|nr:response regulator [Verrucomicrobiales bacterium]